MTWIVSSRLVSEMEQAQLMMLGGFILLGWVLTRRLVMRRNKLNRERQAAKQGMSKARREVTSTLPLSDAPVETQRWQVAMFDLQRELKADLDTRIVVVQTLLKQVDDRIERLSSLEGSSAGSSPLSSIAGQHQRKVIEMFQRGHTADEIAEMTGLPVGDVELAISTIRSR